MNKLKLYLPVRDSNGRFTISQQFGVNGEYYRANGINVVGHNGLDIVCERGAPIYATHDGVGYVGKDINEGLGVIIITNEKFEYKNEETYFKTIYWHLKSWNIGDGQSIKAGDCIGYADSTGFSTGDHLHFGLKPVMPGETNRQWYNIEQSNGYLGCINPINYFNGVFADNIPIQRTLIEKLTLLVNLLRRRLAEKLSPDTHQ